MNNDLNTTFVLDAFNQHVVGGGVPAHETIGPQIWDYGETIADDYVFSLYEECSPSDDPHDLFEDDEIKLLLKLVKQRKDSAAIFREQNRNDLAAPEEAQAKIIAQFLPEQISADAIKKIVDEIITKTGDKGMKDMGKVINFLKKKYNGEMYFGDAVSYTHLTLPTSDLV